MVERDLEGKTAQSNTSLLVIRSHVEVELSSVLHFYVHHYGSSISLGGGGGKSGGLGL